MTYSHNILKQLAITNPKELARILTNPNIDNASLTFGVEILGEEVSDKEIVIPVLKKLLKHVNALVREGAIIGVTAFFNGQTIDYDILNIIKHIKLNDPSPIIRNCAKELLEDL